MPSRLSITAPSAMHIGAVSAVCAQLTNATTRRPAPGRVVSIFGPGALLARARTDAGGEVCAPLTAEAGGHLALQADFTGDASLYPAHASVGVRVTRPRHSVALPAVPAVAAALPRGVPPVPPAPANGGPPEAPVPG